MSITDPERTRVIQMFNSLKSLGDAGWKWTRDSHGEFFTEWDSMQAPLTSRLSQRETDWFPLIERNEHDCYNRERFTAPADRVLKQAVAPAVLARLKRAHKVASGNVAR